MDSPSTAPSARVLLEWLLREEWQRHARFLRTTILATIPLLLLIIASGLSLLASTTALPIIDIGQAAIGIVTVGGAYLGVRVVQQARLQGELSGNGRLTLSPRTLPISDSRLITIFIVKTLLYYGVLVLAPIAVGLSFGLSATPLQLFVALIGMLTLGLAAAIVGLTIAIRSRVAAIGLVVMIVSLLALGVAGLPVTRLTPAIVYETTAIDAVLLGSTSLVTTLVAAIYLFSTMPPTRLRHLDASFARLTRYLDDTNSQRVTVKLLLQFHRSTGGTTKLIGLGTLLAIAVVSVGQSMATVPQVLFLGMGTGLIGVPTYLWLVSYDVAEDYAILPIPEKAVERAIGQAYVMLTMPVSVLMLGTIVFFLRLPLSTALASLLVGISSTLVIGWVALVSLGNNATASLNNPVAVTFIAVSGVVYFTIVTAALTASLPTAVSIALVGLIAAGVALLCVYGLRNPLQI